MVDVLSPVDMDSRLRSECDPFLPQTCHTSDTYSLSLANVSVKFPQCCRCECQSPAVLLMWVSNSPSNAIVSVNSRSLANVSVKFPQSCKCECQMPADLLLWVSNSPSNVTLSVKFPQSCQCECHLPLVLPMEMSNLLSFANGSIRFHTSHPIPSALQIFPSCQCEYWISSALPNSLSLANVSVWFH